MRANGNRTTDRIREAVYGIIQREADLDDLATVSNVALAAEVGTYPTEISRAFLDLEAYGRIKREGVNHSNPPHFYINIRLID